MSQCNRAMTQKM